MSIPEAPCGRVNIFNFFLFRCCLFVQNEAMLPSWTETKTRRTSWKSRVGESRDALSGSAWWRWSTSDFPSYSEKSTRYRLLYFYFSCKKVEQCFTSCLFNPAHPALEGLTDSFIRILTFFSFLLPGMEFLGKRSPGHRSFNIPVFNKRAPGKSSINN